MLIFDSELLNIFLNIFRKFKIKAQNFPIYMYMMEYGNIEYVFLYTYRLR